ncbi:MAG TPA: PhoH family protein [Firmicutes bacterium]|nr:PhoH family protein [Bacillota bacterium]
MENSVDSEHRIPVPDDIDLRLLYGINNTFVNFIRSSLAVDLWVREREIGFRGNAVDIRRVEIVFAELMGLIKKGVTPGETELRYIISLARNGREAGLSGLVDKKIVLTAKNKPITPKTLHQKEYVDAIDKFDVVFGIGPAGTGKTYLAVAKAADFYAKNLIDRIVLVRPAVEAGEKLGFLPGDLQQKVDPFLRPLYDALYDMMSPAKVELLISKGIIEVIPLAYMRGRTLNNAFIIMDEAQNSTPEQMKMFLTRTGFGSKVVVTGDVTQIDLPENKKSGLIHAEQVLEKIGDIAFVYFSHVDVVRHKLVQEIIKAYQYEDANGEKRKNQ